MSVVWSSVIALVLVLVIGIVECEVMDSEGLF